MAGFQSPITIYQAIKSIENNEYLLPAFQREFVWSTYQIEGLFDSLMQGYPISSMLFWKVKGSTTTDFNAILDGQQRLTALHLGLCGSYAYHEYRHS